MFEIMKKVGRNLSYTYTTKSRPKSLTLPETRAETWSDTCDQRPNSLSEGRRRMHSASFRINHTSELHSCSLENNLRVFTGLVLWWRPYYRVFGQSIQLLLARPSLACSWLGLLVLVYFYLSFLWLIRRCRASCLFWWVESAQQT